MVLKLSAAAAQAAAFAATGASPNVGVLCKVLIGNGRLCEVGIGTERRM
jgi:hypothetical protein